jgi:hypothetical protein
MQVVYRANNLIEAHLARHALEELDIPVFIFGESLLGGAGELPMFGVLRVCVPEPFTDQALSCLQELALGQADASQGLEDGDIDGVPAAG